MQSINNSKDALRKRLADDVAAFGEGRIKKLENGVFGKPVGKPTKNKLTDKQISNIRERMAYWMGRGHSMTAAAERVRIETGTSATACMNYHKSRAK